MAFSPFLIGLLLFSFRSYFFKYILITYQICSQQIFSPILYDLRFNNWVTLRLTVKFAKMPIFFFLSKHCPFYSSSGFQTFLLHSFVCINLVQTQMSGEILLPFAHIWSYNNNIGQYTYDRKKEKKSDIFINFI